MEKINVINAQAEGRIDVAGAVGSTEFAMFVYDVPPGERSAPYHYEYEEEWLLVVDGEVVVRTPDGEHTLERGDVARFPAGPDGAHDVTNRSDAPARTLLFSRAGSGVGLSVYPNSDTIGVWGGGGDDLLFRRSSAVPLSERFRE